MAEFDPRNLRCLDEIFGNGQTAPEPSKRLQNETETVAEDDTYWQVKVKKLMSAHTCRRLISELNLEKSLPWHFEPGVSYHCISMGDVDSLTYLRAIVKQQHIRYAILSTWCLAMEDIKEMRSWLAAGYVDRIDFFCGEIFRGTYLAEYNELKSLCHAFGCKMSIFRNHSKVMVIYGDRFDAVIESSANVNTNPRTEQTCITVDRSLADFYKEFFDGIHSFEREFDDVAAYDQTAQGQQGAQAPRQSFF